MKKKQPKQPKSPKAKKSSSKKTSPLRTLAKAQNKSGYGGGY